MEKFFYTATLEAIARKVVKDYDPSLILGQPRAVPIEEIIECRYHLDVEYRYLRKNPIILGCTVFNDTLLPTYNAEEKRYELIVVKGGTIVIDASLLDGRTEGRLRFTLAHELAHWIIHKELYCGTGVAAAAVSKTSMEENSVTERQADILATAILMPSGQVKRTFYSLRAANPRCDYAKELAGLFDVSKQAMRIFLKDHGLL